MKTLILDTLRRNIQSFKDLLKIRELYRPYLGGTSHYCVPTPFPSENHLDLIR